MAGKNLEGGRDDTGRGQILEQPTHSKRPMTECQRIKFLDLAKFKVEKCRNLASGKQHNHKHCRYFHTLRDQRRELDFASVYELDRAEEPLLYTPDICDFYETEDCGNQEECLRSHNRVESVYHPEKYKTKYCTNYPKHLNKCEYGDYCSFAHSTKELRVRLIH